MPAPENKGDAKMTAKLMSLLSANGITCEYANMNNERAAICVKPEGVEVAKKAACAMGLKNIRTVNSFENVIVIGDN
jgi:hypothetical protein